MTVAAADLSDHASHDLLLPILIIPPLSRCASVI
jgi:hypothetical protein